MSEDEKKDPTWKPMELEANATQVVTLKSAKPVASGNSKYGEWNLWTIEIEDATVFERVGNKKVTGYTGDATVFPSEKLHEQFLKHTGGTQEGVKLEVMLVPKKNAKGFYTTYETKLVEGGQTPPNNLSSNEYKFLGDFKKFVAGNIITDTEENFKKFAISDTYGFDAPTAEKLWVIFKE